MIDKSKPSKDDHVTRPDIPHRQLKVLRIQSVDNWQGQPHEWALVENLRTGEMNALKVDFLEKANE